MKRIALIILTILLAAAMMVLPVCAAEEPAVHIPSVSGAPGDTVTLTVSLSGLEKATSLGIKIEAEGGLELVTEGEQASQWLLPSSNGMADVNSAMAYWAVKAAVSINEDVLQLVYRLTDDFVAEEAYVRVTVDANNGDAVIAQGLTATAAFTCAHNETATVVEPTCTEYGYTMCVCQYCGETSYDNYTGALGHSWKDATCTEPETCGNCGLTEGAARGHSWKDATCTEPKTCGNCDLTEGAALGHDMSEWEVTMDPTTSADGEKKRICQREDCGYFEKERIPMLEKTLDAPALKVSNVASTGKIKLSWNAVEGAAKYEIWRATTKDGEYTRLSSTTKTSATNTKVEAGKTYYYKVCAVDANGNKSDWSDVVYRMCDLPQPKVTLSNVASTGKVKLSWEKIEGATKYEIWRSTSKNGTYTKISTVTGTSATNTKTEAGQTYYYKVKALHSNSSANSAYSAVVYRMCDLPQPKVTLSNVASTGKIKLSWEKIEGATKYEIWRATSKNGTYTKISTVTGTSATNTKTEAGKTYYYKVKAIHSNSSANSAYSAVVSRMCDLARPDVTVKLNSKGKPVLSWDKVEGATKYEIYRATSKNGTYTKLSTITGTSAVNNKVESGKTYYYKVRAIHSNANANSAYSAIDSIKVK